MNASEIKERQKKNEGDVCALYKKNGGTGTPRRKKRGCLESTISGSLFCHSGGFSERLRACPETSGVLEQTHMYTYFRQQQTR
jgi:hypothetical protein